MAAFTLMVFVHDDEDGVTFNIAVSTEVQQEDAEQSVSYDNTHSACEFVKCMNAPTGTWSGLISRGVVFTVTVRKESSRRRRR